MYQYKTKYEVGDILYNLATEGHLLIEDIKLIDNHKFYCVRGLETNRTDKMKAGPVDKYAHIIKVA